MQILRDYKFLSEQRLVALSNSKDDIESGLIAFQWEMAARSALLPCIGVTEIALRNALDAAICNWWKSNDFQGVWTDENSLTDVSILRPFVHAKEWKKRATKNIAGEPRDVTHDDLIAHTSFGTWKNMIGNPLSIARERPFDKEKLDSWDASRKRDQQCSILWKQILSGAFSNIPTKKGRGGLSPRAYIGVRISRTASLRNRVCHWDNISKINLQMRFLDICELLEAISPNLREWIETQYRDRIDEVIAEKPSWL